MRRKILVGLGLGALTVCACWAHPSKQILLTFVPTQGDSLWVQPMVAPLVQVKLLEGKAPSKDRRTIMCTQIVRDRTNTLASGDAVLSHVVVFLCEDGTALEMTNVYFGEVK